MPAIVLVTVGLISGSELNRTRNRNGWSSQDTQMNQSKGHPLGEPERV